MEMNQWNPGRIAESHFGEPVVEMTPPAPGKTDETEAETGA
jgi:hypothetical protein